MILGYSTKYIKGPLLNQSCTVCKTYNLHAYAIKKVFDLFWMPCFPFKTSKCVICENCKTHFEGKTLGLDLTNVSIKTPFKCFSGVAVILILVGAGVIFEYFEKEQIRTYLIDPKPNDILVLRSEPEPGIPFTFAKVTKVEGDQITLVEGTTAFSRRSDAKTKARRATPSDFSDIEQHLTIDDLSNLQSIAEAVIR